MSAAEIMTAEAEEYIAKGDEVDIGFLQEATSTLQENNAKLKEFIATEDARTIWATPEEVLATRRA